MTANSIHPAAYIGPMVVLGARNVIGAFAFIDGDVTIGDGNWIGPHVTIGTPSQYSTEKFEFSGQPVHGVRIGDRNVIREFTTVHQPSKHTTVIEDDCYLMAYCHVSHDTRICRGAVLANNIQIGGFTEVQACATVGLSSVIHQFSTIGAYSVVGMGTIISKDVPPFTKAYGNPVRLAGVNAIGLERNGFSSAEIELVRSAIEGKTLPGDANGRIGEAVAAFAARTAQTHRSSLLEA